MDFSSIAKQLYIFLFLVLLVVNTRRYIGYNRMLLIGGIVVIFVPFGSATKTHAFQFQ